MVFSEFQSTKIEIIQGNPVRYLFASGGPGEVELGSYLDKIIKRIYPSMLQWGAINPSHPTTMWGSRYFHLPVFRTSQVAHQPCTWGRQQMACQHRLNLPPSGLLCLFFYSCLGDEGYVSAQSLRHDTGNWYLINILCGTILPSMHYSFPALWWTQWVPLADNCDMNGKHYYVCIVMCLL